LHLHGRVGRRINFLPLLHLQPRSLSALLVVVPLVLPALACSTPVPVPTLSMPLVVATHDVQLSLPDHSLHPSHPRPGGPAIPSPPPSPRSPVNPHALFEAAIIGNLRGFLDALSDPTVDVNILDGSKSRRNALFCALVGTRSVRFVPSPPLRFPVVPRLLFFQLVKFTSAKRVFRHFVQCRTSASVHPRACSHPQGPRGASRAISLCPQHVHAIRKRPHPSCPRVLNRFRRTGSRSIGMP
jgi:hypothetical protein